MAVIILRKLEALSKIAFFSQYFWCFLWKEGAVVIPGRSVGKTNVQYRGLIRRTRPHASLYPPCLNMFLHLSEWKWKFCINRKRNMVYQVDGLWWAQPAGLRLTLSEMTRNKVTANFILPPPLAGPF